ncbi:MAG TPA: 1,2-phenylacetyl-CoA epoxidase subunit PaaA [Myxococcota bacterium]|jgi:ring-1,2-phenylacetyl-CoA epoxidase subunit PaaA
MSDSNATATPHDAEREARFLARIDAGEKIEPGDWMPEAYRRQLIRMISQHAHSEVVGMLPEGNWITRAPSLKRKIGMLTKVQDEGGHGLYLYAAAETLGVSREELIAALLSGEAKYSSIFNYPALTWADAGTIGWLVDQAAIVNQTLLARASYGPYARAMQRICAEERFHERQGYEIVAALAQGTLAQRAMAQDSLDRWWWPTLMMFGPPDIESRHSAQLLRWRVKQESNDVQREWFVNLVVPQAEAIALRLPDPALRKDPSTGRWQHGPIDWSEFRSVLAGGGPCGRDRVRVRREVQERGAWVRAGAEAYAAKHAASDAAP